ncbi:MAG: NADH-quinone oxidoreductase subunit J [Armatimonadetes bacterium]|nr:NADH-quinone oxidoreductase subunit J [Armatimonadota bacterium]
MTGQLIFFAILAAISVVCAVAMIATENPVRSALNLVLVLFSVALLFVLLHATFLAAVQIIVYAGAIMVLFIFVIMLLNLGTPERVVDRLRPQKWISPILGLIVVGILAAVIASLPVPQSSMLPAKLIGPLEIGQGLFQAEWLFPFEVVSILLLVAAIGAVMLAKKRI